MVGLKVNKRKPSIPLSRFCFSTHTISSTLKPLSYSHLLSSSPLEKSSSLFKLPSTRYLTSLFDLMLV